MAYENNPIDSKIKQLRPDLNTAEQATGITWGPNGRQIYRVVVATGALPNNSTISITLPVSGTIHRVINIYGHAYQSSTDRVFPLPFAAVAASLAIGVRTVIGTKKVLVNATSNYSALQGHFVVEYTKAT